MSHPRFLAFLETLHRHLDARAATGGDPAAAAAPALGALVAHDDWLPEEYCQPHPQYYQQYLLYRDPIRGFSVVSFVWGPGQFTPLHDHQTWGVVGVLRGAELTRNFQRHADHGLVPEAERRLSAGEIELITHGDHIHQVKNAYADRVSVSIHLYGADIGRQARHVFDAASGQAKPFVSGYVNDEAWLQR